MKIFCTGFGPFGKIQDNPSATLACALAESIPTHDVQCAVLPVCSKQAPKLLHEHLQRFRPDLLLCLGVAESRLAIHLERVAINLMDFPIPDASGFQAQDQPISAEGPPALFVRAPLKAMLNEMQAFGVPCELSLSAGSYLCNQIMYLSLLWQSSLTHQAAFIHIPPFATLSGERQMIALRAGLLRWAGDSDAP